MSEQGQQVRSEGRHLGAGMTFALGKKDMGMVPVQLTGHLALRHWKAEGEGCFQKDSRVPAGKAASAVCAPRGAQLGRAGKATCADLNQLLRDSECP